MLIKLDKKTLISTLKWPQKRHVFNKGLPAGSYKGVYRNFNAITF